MLEINKIHLGDSKELLKLVDDKTIDLVVIDPPYDFKHGGKMTGLFRDRGTRHFDALEQTGLTLNYDYIPILDDLVRVMKFINIYIWCNKEQLQQYLDYFMKNESMPKVRFEMIIWNKTNPIPLVSNRYLPDKEYCLYFGELGKAKIYGSYETKKTVYYEQANTDDKKKYGHPTIKPVHIVENIILNSSKENDLILDCFMGSGTTAVACINTNRNYIGMEISEKYYQQSLDRLKNITVGVRKEMEDGVMTIFDFLGESE